MKNRCLHKPVVKFPRRLPGQTFVAGHYQCKRCGKRLVKRVSTGTFLVASGGHARRLSVPR